MARHRLDRTLCCSVRAPSVGGLIVVASGTAYIHRDLIITLAARHKLPAVYFERSFVAAGGLVSYGPNYIELYRQAAGYVYRILKGEKPADLPVQAPTIRYGDKPQNRKGAWLGRAAGVARPSR